MCSCVKALESNNSLNPELANKFTLKAKQLALNTRVNADIVSVLHTVQIKNTQRIFTVINTPTVVDYNTHQVYYKCP